MRIFLTGFMGCGKSFTGKKIAEQLNLSFIDLDDWLEEKARMSISQIFEKKGETFFRQLEAKALRSFAEQKNIVLACGGGTVCFHNNMQWINEHGLSIFLDCSEELLFQRLHKETSSRPLLMGKTEEELRYFIHKKLSERLPFYSQARISIHQEKEDSQLSQHIVKTIRKIKP